MDDREMLQTILNAVSAVTVQLDKMEARLTAVDAELKNMGDRLDGLEAGQEALRRDVARIERKIDHRLSQLQDAKSARLDEIELIQTPARATTSPIRSITSRKAWTTNCAKPDNKQPVFTSAEACKASMFCSHGRFYAIPHMLN